MKIFAFIPAFAVLAMLAFAGCGSVRGGRTIVKFDEARRPITTTVPASGTYALYSYTDLNPKVTVTLKENDQIGFKSSDTGQVIAVAGDREIPLNANDTYYWKQQ